MVGSMPQYNNFHPSHTSAVLEPRHLVEDTWDYSLDSYSDVTNWGKRANPPSQTRYRTWTHLVCILVLVFFWFSELCFFFSNYFFMIQGQCHPQPESTSFFNFFACWSLRPLQLPVTFQLISPLAQKSTYVTAPIVGDWFGRLSRVLRTGRSA